MTNPKFQLEYTPAERQILEVLRKIRPPSGFGESDLKLVWHEEQIVRVIVKESSEQQFKIG